MAQLKIICYVVSSFPMPSETFISDEANSMFEFGIKPYILSFNKGRKDIIHSSASNLLKKDCVKYIKQISHAESLWSIFKLFFRKPLRIIKCLITAYSSEFRWLYFQSAKYAFFCLEKNICFIHAHFADMNFVYASILSDWTGIPFGVTTHGYDLRNEPIPTRTASNLFQRANLVVTISKYNKRLMLEKFDIPYEQIEIVHCGVDLIRFKYSQNFITCNQKVKLINIGRLVEEKAHDVLLKALNIVRKKGVIFELSIIGSGPLEKELKELCRHLRLEDCVSFEGAQPQHIIIDMLQKADVFVLSSRSEGIPVVCMETMAIGTPIIATNIAGIPELIIHKKNGLLVCPDNSESLAQSICWAYNNQDKMQEMSKNAREKIEQDFDRIKCTHRLINKMGLF